MESRVILLDTSILIDYYRKTNKNNSVFIDLSKRGYKFCISTITVFEIYRGVSAGSSQFWNDLFSNMSKLHFDESWAKQAVYIDRQLKKKSKQIDLADLFIAATAQNLNIPLATLNLKHFKRIEGLEILS